MISLRTSVLTIAAVVASGIAVTACSDSMTDPLSSRAIQPIGALSYSVAAGNSTFQYGIFALGSVTFTGGAYADAYVSGSGSAHAPTTVGTLGSVTLSGNATIYGDASAAGTITANGNGSGVTGTATQHASNLPTYTAPSCPTTGYSPASSLPVPLPKHVTYNAATGVLSLTGGAQLTLSAANAPYYFSQVSLSGNSVLDVAATSTSHVDIYISDKLDASGGSLTSEASSATGLTVWGCGTASTSAWSFTGGSKAFYGVFAPGHDINLTGNGNFYGAVVGHNVSGTGGSQYHVDGSIVGTGSTGGTTASTVLDARVLFDSVGNATLEARTGTFNDSTNTGTLNGYFTKLEYKIVHAGKTLADVKVNLDKNTSVYTTVINLCSSQVQGGDDDDDDDDGHHMSTQCNTHISFGDQVSIIASLAGTGTSGKGTANNVTVAATDEYLPDVVLKGLPIYVVTNGVRSTTTPVTPGTPTTFSVDVPNTRTINGVAPSVGANTICVVTVDGKTQLPLPIAYLNPFSFSYVGPATESIPPGGTSSCSFTLTLPAGPHTIAVTAVPAYPGDYNPFNNTTSQTFTVQAVAQTGAPDVAVGTLQMDSVTTRVVAGTAANALVMPDVTKPITTNFYQNFSLASGAGPTTTTCTVFVNAVAVPVTPAPATLATTGATGQCTFPLTFTAPGSYSIIVATSSTNDVTNTNDTSKVTLKVVAGPPSSNVTLGGVQFSDANTGVTGTLLTGATAAPGDTIHSGDLVTYSAAVAVNSLINTSGVTVTCSATIKTSTGATVDASKQPGFVWVSGPTLTNIGGGLSGTCSFKIPLTETSPSPVSDQVGFAITTSIPNTAVATATNTTVTVSNVQRVDESAGGFQLADGTGALLDTTPVKQNTTVTLQVPVTNLNTVGATAVSCGPILAAVNPVTYSAATAGYVLGANDSTPSALSPTQVAPTSFSLNPGQTSFCKYTLTSPSNLGLISIPLTAIVTTQSGSPLDPVPLNNIATTTFTIASNNQFTVVPTAQQCPACFQAQQEWLEPGPGIFEALGDGLVNGLLPSTATLVNQSVSATQLALLVVPTAATLGNFQLTGTVTVTPPGGTPILLGTGSSSPTPQALGPSSGSNVCIQPAGNGQAPLTGGQSANEPQLGFNANICATPASTGFQTITVNYTQSLSGVAALAANPVVFNGTVTLTLTLNFQLTNSPKPDHVTAVLQVPVSALSNGCTFGDSASIIDCTTLFGQYSVSTGT